MMSNLDRLAYMVNQIARNFEVQGHDFAVTATAHHVTTFWDPRMKAQIRDVLNQGTPELGPIAREAITRLCDANAPFQATGGPEFNRVDEVGHSDAG